MVRLMEQGCRDVFSKRIEPTLKGQPLRTTLRVLETIRRELMSDRDKGDRAGILGKSEYVRSVQKRQDPRFVWHDLKP